MSLEISQQDLDVEYLYDKASQYKLNVEEEDEEIFVELVGKQVSDGHSNLESRRRAFTNWVKDKK